MGGGGGREGEGREREVNNGCLLQGQWSVTEGGRPTTREDLMMVLQSIQSIHIKSHYDNQQDSVR